MRITTVASVALVLAMAAPAMAAEGWWTSDRRTNGPGHVRNAGDRDGSNRWNEGRRGDHDRWRGDDGRRGDHDGRHGDHDGRRGNHGGWRGDDGRRDVRNG